MREREKKNWGKRQLERYERRRRGEEKEQKTVNEQT